MRYLFPIENQNEARLRQEYLYTSLGIITERALPTSPHFAELAPISNQNNPDLFIIIGHTNAIYHYISQNQIHEENIVLVTCNFGQYATLDFSEKNVYMAHQRFILYKSQAKRINRIQQFAPIYRGQDYGFKFDLTESEIRFFNSRNYADCHNLNDRLRYSFDLIYSKNRKKELSNLAMRCNMMESLY